MWVILVEIQVTLIILSDYQILTFSSSDFLIASKRQTRKKTILMERWVVGVSKLCTITRIPTNSFNRLLKLFFFYLHATMDGYKVWLEWHDNEQQFGCRFHQRLNQIQAIHQAVSCFSLHTIQPRVLACLVLKHMQAFSDCL